MSSINIYPTTPETIYTFQKMVQKPNEDVPVVEMNDETARDMSVIRSSIKALASNWRGRDDLHIPGKPINRQEFWGVFAAENSKLLPVAKEFIESSSGQGKTAIDLGCGNGSITKLLLEKGWRVIAVDNSKLALAILKSENKAKVASNQLEIVEADVTTFAPSAPADLVIASDIFPYIDPSKFESTWSKIHDIFVKENGFLVGTLFRAPTKSEGIPLMNLIKEMGAWFLPDRRMVRPLLTQIGYEIKTCKYRMDDTDEPICIQFIAEKKNVTA